MFGFLLGLCFGSFANVVILRLPAGKSVVRPGSACMACGQSLKWIDMIPLLSWVCLGGKCRHCRANISWQYPAVEAACGLLFAMAAFLFSPLVAAVNAIILFSLLCIAVIDAKTMIIPDCLVVLAGIASITYVAAWSSWHGAAIGLLVGGLPLLIIDRISLLLLKKDGFGFGDVKLMAVLGFWLGWQLVLVSFLFAFVAGAAFAVFLICSGKTKRGSYLAFGPFLCAASVAAYIFGQKFIELLFTMQENMI
ncbi:MAG: prepilin peptidase [Defluviitaleaceae bacterium]|nr:prepilin peptidase [Defluviitaleaceae bacterium]